MGVSASCSFPCPIVRCTAQITGDHITDISKRIAAYFGHRYGLCVLVTPIPAGALYLARASVLWVTPGYPAACAIGRLLGVSKEERCYATKTWLACHALLSHGAPVPDPNSDERAIAAWSKFLLTAI